MEVANHRLISDHSPASPIPTKPWRCYCKGMGIVRQFLLADLLIRARNEWLN